MTHLGPSVFLHAGLVLGGLAAGGLCGHQVSRVTGSWDRRARLELAAVLDQGVWCPRVLLRAYLWIGRMAALRWSLVSGCLGLLLLLPSGAVLCCSLAPSVSRLPTLFTVLTTLHLEVTN